VNCGQGSKAVVEKKADSELRNIEIDLFIKKTRERRRLMTSGAYITKR